MDDLIKQIKKSYQLDITSMKVVCESSDNQVLLLETAGADKYVARISKRAMGEGINFESAWLEYLYNQKVTVPRIIKTADGLSYGKLSNGAPVVVFEFVAGEHIVVDEKNKPPLACIKAGAEALAMIHNVSRDIKLELPRKRTIFTELERVLVHQKDFEEKISGGKEFIKEVKKFIKWGKKQVFVPVLMHNDYRISNLLFKDGSVAAVLDFDWCCMGPAIKDVAHALAEWSFLDKAEKHWDDVFQEFLENYNNMAIDRISADVDLYHWISFACLSDAATYLVDRLERGEIKSTESCYMYKKFKYFSALSSRAPARTQPD